MTAYQVSLEIYGGFFYQGITLITMWLILGTLCNEKVLVYFLSERVVY